MFTTWMRVPCVALLPIHIIELYYITQTLVQLEPNAHSLNNGQMKKLKSILMEARGRGTGIWKRMGCCVFFWRELWKLVCNINHIVEISNNYGNFIFKFTWYTEWCIQSQSFDEESSSCKWIYNWIEIVLPFLKLVTMRSKTPAFFVCLLW